MIFEPRAADLDPLDLENALLRAAVGDYADEAAVLLLVNCGHWLPRLQAADLITLVPDLDGEGLWAQIDWPDLPAALSAGTLMGSSGEEWLLRAAASIADGSPVDLGELAAGLDRRSLTLVLAALAHAAGSHDHPAVTSGPGGTPCAGGTLPPVVAWPPAGPAMTRPTSRARPSGARRGAAVPHLPADPVTGGRHLRCRVAPRRGWATAGGGGPHQVAHHRWIDRNTAGGETMGWIGPVADDQEHEGWVVPLFADGAQGAGTSSARGILVTRPPGDGPHDGDRVRLIYRDGSTVEGIWQDGTILRADGIVHGHTTGQLARDVIEETEEWRPDAAVVGWAAGCTCGWRGTTWTRVAEPELADPTARRLAAPGPWADLDATDETRVIQEWRIHIAPWRALEEVEAAASRQTAAARALEEAVHTAVAAGASWAEIGRATGTTPCTAAERWPARA